ncbi:MAG: 4-hydroxybenzoyl-CoA thioesterase [Rhodoferax sp.]|nr:4-hydroxybenzoyl-CoA thioesterase [Rhodoferax sp.]
MTRAVKRNSTAARQGWHPGVLAESGRMNQPSPTSASLTAAPASAPAPAEARLQPEQRGAYPMFRAIATRWSDNDAYGHVNNVIYYHWFDTVVNSHLVAQGALDIAQGTTIGLVVETHCNYFTPLAFPQGVELGLRVAHLGRTSVRYEIGVFAEGAATAAAQGHFIHVYVDRATRRPQALPPVLLQALQPLRAAG